MLFRTALCLSGVLALLTGCASSRVVAPAGDIAKAVAAFQADLSVFQKSTRDLQADQAALAAGNDVSRNVSARTLEQIKVQQAVADASTFADMQKILQTQADSHLAALLDPPGRAATPASAKMPLDKLGVVAGIVQGIAKRPDRGEELEFLAGFAKQTNDDLAALAKEKK